MAEERERKESKTGNELIDALAVGLGLFLASKSGILEKEEEKEKESTASSFEILPAGAGEGESSTGIEISSLYTYLEKIVFNSSAIISGISSILSEVRNIVDAIKSKDFISTVNIAKKYNSGQLVVDSADMKNVWGGDSSIKVSLYAKKLDWKIKILTIGDIKEGKTIDEVDFIYLDEGTAYEDNINAVRLYALCESAVPGNEGILYWEVSY